MRKHIYRHFLFLSLVGLMQLTLSCSSSDEIDLSKPEEGDTPLEKEEYTFVNVEYRKWQNGTFQAWTTADSRETRTIDYMNWYTPSSDYSRTAWGGRIGLQPSSVVGKEGFFRVASCAGRSYLLDPDNGAVIIHGIQHVRPGESTAHKKAFSTRYGSEARWSEEAGKLIADNHINYISYGSNRIEAFPAAVRNNLLTPKTQKIAYAENLYLLRTFMWDMSKNLGYTFEDDKYNRLILLFEPTFAAYIDHLVQEKSALFAGDKHFIGFYLDNELPFASYQNTDPLRGIDLKHFLSLPERYKTAREYAEKFMRDNGIVSAGAITKKDQEDFRGMVADYYYQLTTTTVRKYDKEHLILGTRLHDWSKYNQKVVEACARYCDLVSINYYARWQPETDFLANLKAWCGAKPFLVSEFYTKAEDASYQGTRYANTEGGGWLVHTQKNRGEFYQNFCLRLLETRNCVGWVHFEYNDGYDSDGKASNKGVVSIEYEPYGPFLSQMRQLNLAVYSLIDYYDAKSVQ
ncbi:hypothetical protein BOVA604_4393 [Bacteroides ovatus]|uniref:hypothetical protein n=1 Tax=Bacteroides TaxID=816 RepID=UPI000E9C8E7A|nr:MULTISPECIES: hypothetical protein [Bacteroides]MCS3176416.1 hypothetical protein [Candidatus Bacteroides intestinigallinarum]RGN64567.1 hypothetical protein DXB58_05370 [Bacteroides sp. OM05-10AA]RGQ67453.1 hypothetical protein DWY87_07010 [Bacteroides sp. AF27-33]CAG9901260.1 hypothetical protein BOVA604_4393 [Bacteroides ovatus]